MNLTKAYSFHSAREPRITYQSKIENDLPQLNHCSNWMFVLKNIFTILLLEFDKIKCFFYPKMLTGNWCWYKSKNKPLAKPGS